MPRINISPLIYALFAQLVLERAELPT